MRDAAMARTLRRLAALAGAAILQVRDSGAIGAVAKDDDSPVTRADLAADRIIAEGLAAAYPAIPAVTEERPDSHRGAAAATFFLVDPLDGTREFVSGRDGFTVNIALITDGAPVAGVVYAPASGRLFMTTPDGGAVEERTADGGPDPDAPGPQRRIGVATPPAAGPRVVASRSHRDAETDAYITRVNASAITPAGSSLKFCLIAAGEADLYPRFGPTMAWDTAAGHAVLAAAGGLVLRLPERAPLRYGAGALRNPAFLAAGYAEPP